MESDSLNSGVATLNEPGTALDLASSAHLTPADFTVSDATRARILDSVAANTTTAYARCWRQFTDWCVERGRTPLPTTPQTLADYMTYMVDDAPRSIATCKQAIAAIRTQNRMAGHGRNAPDLELANAVLKSAGRQRAEDGEGGQRKAAPVIVRSLKRMIATCDSDSLLDVRDHALLTLGIAIFGRRSELSALQFTDLRANPDGISVTIRKSKTDQAGKGATISVVNGTFIDTNPVTAVERWKQRLAERGINNGRLFRAINVHGNPLPSMSGANINLAVQARARMAQLADLDEYSAHSLRAGAATIAYMNNTPISEICRMGRWSSNSSVVMGYIRAVDEWRNNPFRGVL